MSAVRVGSSGVFPNNTAEVGAFGRGAELGHGPGQPRRETSPCLF